MAKKNNPNEIKIEYIWDTINKVIELKQSNNEFFTLDIGKRNFTKLYKMCSSGEISHQDIENVILFLTVEEAVENLKELVKSMEKDKDKKKKKK